MSPNVRFKDIAPLFNIIMKVSIMATKRILPGEEIFSDYGPLVKWKNLPSTSASLGDEESNDRSDGHQSSGTDDHSSDETWSPPTSDPRQDCKPSDGESGDTTSDVVEEEASALADENKMDKPKVADVLDKLWCDKVELDHDFRADSVRDPKVKAHQWYENLCNSILGIADKVLPRKRKKKAPRRETSQRTKDLFAKRQRMTKRNSTKKQFKDIQSRIKESCLKDFQDWVDKCVREIEDANNLGDIRRVYNLVKKLSNKPKPPPSNLTKSADGKILKDPKDKVRRWESFLKGKFEATPEELIRPSMPPLPTTRTSDDILTRAEFDQAMKRMKNSKASGPDDIPIEVFKSCPQLADELFNFIQFVWDNEVLPTNMAIAKFVMLYKNKGSTNDPSKYRCIGLLNHSYKLLTTIMLARLLGCSEKFLKD